MPSVLKVAMRIASHVLGVMLVTGSVAAASAAGIGPSFDCAKAHQPLAEMICADPALSHTDMLFAQAYWALYWQVGASGQPALKREDLVNAG